MGFFKKLLKSPIFKIAAPLALSVLAPGVGTALGSALGATGAGASALGSGLIGAGLGAVEGGGLKGAALGGITGGLGGYVSGSGGLTGVANNLGFGNAAYGALDAADNGGLLSSVLGSNGLSGVGSGLLGAADKATGGLASGGNVISDVLGSANGGGTGGAFNAAANLYSGVQGTKAYKDLARVQQAANDKSIAALNPYVASGTAANQRLSGLLGIDGGDPASQLEALQSSPGYKFKLDQGTQALNRSLGAQGNLFSGRALKEAEQFGQGLADQTFNDYAGQLSQQSAAGQNAAGAMGGLNDNTGNISANSIIGKNNTLNQSLANILGSNVGGFSGGQLSGYKVIGKDANGNPIYGVA